MEDIYEYNTSPFNVVYGGVKYVTTRRDYSNELVEKGIIQARKQFGNDLVPENCNAEMYQSGALSKLSREYFMYGFETELRKLSQELRRSLMEPGCANSPAMQHNQLGRKLCHAKILTN